MASLAACCRATIVFVIVFLHSPLFVFTKESVDGVKKNLEKLRSVENVIILGDYLWSKTFDNKYKIPNDTDFYCQNETIFEWTRNNAKGGDTLFCCKDNCLAVEEEVADETIGSTELAKLEGYRVMVKKKDLADESQLWKYIPATSGISQKYSNKNVCLFKGFENLFSLRMCNVPPECRTKYNECHEANKICYFNSDNEKMKCKTKFEECINQVTKMCTLAEFLQMKSEESFDNQIGDDYQREEEFIENPSPDKFLQLCTRIFEKCQKESDYCDTIRGPSSDDKEKVKCMTKAHKCDEEEKRLCTRDEYKEMKLKHKNTFRTASFDDENHRTEVKLFNRSRPFLMPPKLPEQNEYENENEDENEDEYEDENEDEYEDKTVRIFGGEFWSNNVVNDYKTTHTTDLYCKDEGNFEWTKYGEEGDDNLFCCRGNCLAVENEDTEVTTGSTVLGKLGGYRVIVKEMNSNDRSQLWKKIRPKLDMPNQQSNGRVCITQAFLNDYSLRKCDG